MEGGARIRALRHARNLAVGRAVHVFCPSAYLREIAIGWGLPEERISVLPNPAPVVPELPDREALRVAFGMSGLTLAFAGRLTLQKDLRLALDAIGRVASVSLVLLGDGPERASLESYATGCGLGDRVRFLGGGSRDTVLELFRAADGSLLSSAWENFPHTVVEALAVGTPVIATAVGGVPEVVQRRGERVARPARRRGGADGRDRAVRVRFRAACPSCGGGCPLRRGVRAGTAARTRRSGARQGGGGPTVSTPKRKPRVLFVSRSRYSLPLSDGLAKKWDAIGEELDYRVVGGARAGSAPSTDTFRLSTPSRPAVLDGALSQGRLPYRIRRQIKEFEPDVIVCADPFICAAALTARRLAGTSVPVICEVHGDWRTFTRSYGMGARRLLGVPADALAEAALRRADATRALSPFTSGLIEEVRGEPATASFATYSDLSAFVEHPVAPLPERRWRSSSACSRRTRTSTAWQRPGAGSQPSCRKPAS